MAGKPTDKMFGIFAALGTVAFSFGDAMLPEIQVPTCSMTPQIQLLFLSVSVVLTFFMELELSSPHQVDQ